MADRQHIPNELQRALMLEVGYRCPLCKQTEPLEFEHIEDWATVRKHEFTNMIVLCASCHGRKQNTSSPRHINRASLKKLKNSLMLLNGRFSDLERRVLEQFQHLLAQNPDDNPIIRLQDTMLLLVMRLQEDGLASITHHKSGVSVGMPGGKFIFGVIDIALTPNGKSFVQDLIDVTSV